MARKSRIHASRPGAPASIGWDADFAGLPPIELPDGRKLETLAECAAYILELPKKQQQEPRWQQVTAELLKAAELGQRVQVHRKSVLLTRAAWRVRRLSDTEGAGQERRLEG